MPSQLRTLAFIAFIACSAVTATPLPNTASTPSSTCPPKDFDAVKVFDLEAYLGNWFLQYSTVTSYLQENQFYCVTASYSRLSENTIDVFNYSNNDTVNGVVQATIPSLRGTIEDPSRPSKLTVHPSFLPVAAGGPYWVVATSLINEKTHKYSWSIVSGGPPNEVQPNGLCLADKQGSRFGNGQGLFFLARDRLLTEEARMEMKKKATELGLDISSLKKVVHDGCFYKFPY
ncbi:hypothetical protein HDU67_005499 [Dinochytrium kinnereticum]|nr:hypothetical protein HDU67_005499 [Dinochytrium kinnereticum]